MKPVVRRVLTCLLGPVLVVALAAGPAVAAAESYWLTASAAFAPPTGTDTPSAVTYDVDEVPTGSRLTVTEFALGERMAVRLSVFGLRPDRAYGAHVHTRPCGELPADSGPHYQHRRDPVQPSTDPAYANPDNEVWLDLSTGASGHGTSWSQHDWRFRPGGANSVVLHEHHTSTEPGHAGQAGARLACFTVPFE